jgi:hypothetical protein
MDGQNHPWDNRFCGAWKTPLFIGSCRKFRIMCGADLSDIDEQTPGERTGIAGKRAEQDKGEEGRGDGRQQ